MQRTEGMGLCTSWGGTYEAKRHEEEKKLLTLLLEKLKGKRRNDYDRKAWEERAP